MKHLNDPFKQLSDYKKRKKISDKNKKRNKVRIYLPKGLAPIYCGKEKIKFVKTLNYN